jgi:hypothetical protein
MHMHMHMLCMSHAHAHATCTCTLNVCLSVYLSICLSVYIGSGLIALALFFVRSLLVWLLGLASAWLSLPPDSRLQKLRGSGLDRVLQAHAQAQH